ncbi:hypothetical protein ZMO1_ZMO1729 [Zymomonas mobilis subsp. mobilis ZM4 = ATCC 31821]|uniref:DUF2794 domain-containing protein n=2 Tax=Zymomonas mobilis subsp. mobilis TaxID=120045 RepID=Q5NLQ7_ZYMMO|nr:DUF2794 domain-containing protein [Zymomonas mobilis]AAV90353.2 conserved hypothetical protein [Zymomonas mobilis subsp. mobilis ZM4 = ATCC 31821]ACV76029.1 conserved hypothetical protein [Zymomonas mobilis subsp. mobilis NCIMB 11163]AEH63230.1 conserved hypothetical protein [Zymomonas mobilis subsp. mobilis ATCC 10988]ART93844.1 hypothetical protein B9T50_06805 [Zymomonas mobilis subsp. mobilis]AVZ26547.1 hypothetical protein ZMO2_ZMO1729 [Zymomonas mobilis subsp. mobilis]
MSSITPIAPMPRYAVQVGFTRPEILRLMDLYGRMVAAGHWRDYALSFETTKASFSAFRRTAERPEYRVEKQPALRLKQGMWILYGEGGQILKRSHELVNILAPIERRLIKLIAD